MMRAIAVVAAGMIVGAGVATAYAGELPATGCEPSWARACAPTADGTASLDGVVTGTKSGLAIVYRNVEGSLGPHAGTADYGPWRQTGISHDGTFSLSLPACAPQARFDGCIGGAYELYAARDGKSCTEMWYAGLIVGEQDHLPENAFICNHAVDVAPLTQGTFGGPMCEPYWARNCMPGTAGITFVRGTITRPSANVGPFSMRHVALAYRTVDRGLNYGLVYGTTHYMRVHSGGFALKLWGCSPSIALTLGCAGGSVEAWPTYDHIQCGKATGGIVIAGQPQRWGVGICDTRGVLEGRLNAAKGAGWEVLVHGKNVYNASVKDEGQFLLRLPRGEYHVTARNGHKRCAKTYRVKIGLASKRSLTMLC